ncbi:smad nuclear-interacting protein 1 [Copidosoma floridanum]|uniref:smad nuclear-interacting protein 1 n=1 Tax=Copidosoma floridanum TaxID=29053 RepID=UPI0006C996A9|nr:smad nuclear-interacting protein 1 [Copidosoma floridanum]
MSRSRHDRRSPEHHKIERKRKHSDTEDHHRGSGERGSAGSSSRWDEKRSQQRNVENKRPKDREDEDKRHRRHQHDDDALVSRRRDKNDKRSRFEQPFLKKGDNEPSPEWGKARVKKEGKAKIEKDKPNFQTSGKLTEDTNTVNGIVIKYSEPQEARKPKRRWRLYPFKGEEALPVLYIHRQSAYLIGRDRKIADLPIDHPSCSKQHAALQYRLVTFKRENGSEGKRIRPYLIDLESANGTYVNNVKLEPKRYHELMERDVIKFGFSSREYVVLHEQSKDEDLDDDFRD